ncbi:MAG TPA: hypothetical protein VGL81_17915 [Polyangiaceae bacterium]
MRQSRRGAAPPRREGEYSAGDRVELASVDCTLVIDELYRDPLAARSA